jgi:cytochrome P450
VILQAVFGYEPGPTEQELARRIRAFIEPLSQPRNLMRMALALGRRSAQADGFQRRRQAVDKILLAEIERRRQLPEDELAQSQDIFSALLLAEDEAGQRLTDGEVRDELMTLLLAGHETTANGLAWAFDLLLHHPDSLEQAREQDPAYLDAVAKESLRLRPVIPGVGRVVRNEPLALGEWVIPPGHEINPSIRMIHARSDLYPQPRSFRPERFLTESPPDTYTWLPFGGGIRRCLGASFALMEMRVVLSRVLERTQLRPASPKPDKPVLKVITLSPKRGAQVIQHHPPQP